MKLIIVEKPDEMRKILSAVDGNAAKRIDSHYESIENIYTSCFGHLLEQKMPKEINEKYSKWSINDLPLDFETIPLKVKDSAKKQFNLIKSLVADSRVTEIVNACDSDREGELIFWNLFELIKMPKRVTKISRMWINEQTPAGLKKAFYDRQDDMLYDNLRKAAKCRSHADYYIGLGSTMGMTTKFGAGSVLTVGRVQTPTLTMIVDLDRQINDFKPNKFYGAIAILEETSLGKQIIGEYVIPKRGKDRLDDEKEADDVVIKTGTGLATVTKSVSTTKRESCKQLHSLSSLQIEMNRRYGYSAQLVLDTCQNLYEKYALTTYPRTDENTVSAGTAEQSKTIVKNLPVYREFCDNIVSNNYKMNKNCISGATEIGAHEALTPVMGTINASTIDSLPTIERNVFNEIVERFLQSFYPDAVYENQKVEFTRNGCTFRTKNKTIVDYGYLIVSKSDKKFGHLVDLKKSDTVHILKVEKTIGETKPPNRFSEGSLIAAMVNPTKFVESKEDVSILKEIEGIGTEATRPGIIEGLKRNELIIIQKNQIFPTEKAYFLINSIPDENIKSVKLTADFEKKLKLMAKGEYSSTKFETEVKNIMKNFIEVLKMQEGNKKKYGTPKGETLCKCPVCGANIIANEKGYFCEECEVKIFKDTLKKALGYNNVNKTQAKELLTNGKTAKKADLVSIKKGTKYQAYLIYKFDKDAKYQNNVWISFE